MPYICQNKHLVQYLLIFIRKENYSIDEIKNLYCKEHNISLIRIKYNENIYNKLKNKLKL